MTHTRTPCPASAARRRLSVTTLALLLGALLALPFASAQGTDEARAILDRVVDNLRGVSQRATLDLTVQRPDRSVRYSMEIVTDGDRRSLARVTAPPREAGQAFLSVGNNLLVYSPRLGRSLRLPPSGRSNAFLGSDLSYDDLAGEEYRDQYTASVASRDAGIVTLDLVPLPEAPTPYGKLVFDVAEDTATPQRLTFFDQRGNAVRRIEFSEFRDVAGRRVPERFEVVDLLREGYRTVAAWSDAEYGLSIPDRCFTEAALERGCF